LQSKKLDPSEYNSQLWQSLSMKPRAGQVAQAKTSDRQRAIRRILQVIDEVGGDAASTDVQNEALQGILDSDTFYYTTNNGTLGKYNLHTMRELAASIAYECKLKAANGEDRVARLLRNQSRVLPPKRLRRWQHVPVQVPFESKQTHISQTLATRRPESTRMAGPVILKDFQGPNGITFREKSKLFRHRALWVVLQDIDASRSERNNSDHQYSTYEMRLTALQDLCERFRLQYPTQKTHPREYTGKSLHEVIRDAWGRLRTHDSITLGSLWREGTESCLPERLQEIKAAYDASEGGCNNSLAQDHAAPEASTHEHDKASRGSASSLTSVDNITVDSRPQSKNDPTEPDTLVNSHDAKPRRLKRKASAVVAETESPPSNASSFGIVRLRSPIVDPPSHDLVEVQAAQVLDNQDTMPLDKPSRLCPKDVLQQMHDIRDLQITQVKWMIGYFKLPSSPSPVTVTPEPNQLLATLYTRCWGDEWRRDGDLLLRQDKRSIFNDTMALISSFLFERILMLTSESDASMSARRSIHSSETN
jgi:hypothetical protein